MDDLGLPFEPAGFPVEFLSLGGIGPGVPVRATVTDFGPQLLAKVLGANETQEQSLALVFRFADEHGLALLDLADLRALLTYLDSAEGKADLKGIGGVSGQTIGVLEKLLTEVGTGEAAVTLLSEKGVPTPVVHTRLRGPRSSMTPAADVERVAQASALNPKYGTRLDRESAHEPLAARVERAPEPEAEPKPRKRTRKADAPSDPLGDFLGSRQGRALQREIVRGVFGMLRKKL